MDYIKAYKSLSPLEQRELLNLFDNNRTPTERELVNALEYVIAKRDTNHNIIDEDMF